MCVVKEAVLNRNPKGDNEFIWESLKLKEESFRVDDRTKSFSIILVFTLIDTMTDM